MKAQPCSQDIAAAKVTDREVRFIPLHHRQPSNAVLKHFGNGVVRQLIGKGNDQAGFSSIEDGYCNRQCAQLNCALSCV